MLEAGSTGGLIDIEITAVRAHHRITTTGGAVHESGHASTGVIFVVILRVPVLDPRGLAHLSVDDGTSARIHGRSSTINEGMDESGDP